MPSGIYPRTEEHKRKLSKSHKGKPTYCGFCRRVTPHKNYKCERCK